MEILENITYLKWIWFIYHHPIEYKYKINQIFSSEALKTNKLVKVSGTCEHLYPWPLTRPSYNHWLPVISATWWEHHTATSAGQPTQQLPHVVIARGTTKNTSKPFSASGIKTLISHLSLTLHLTADSKDLSIHL